MEGLKGKEDFIGALKAGYAHFWVMTQEPIRVGKLMTEALDDYSKEDPSRSWKPMEWSFGQNSDDPIAPLQELVLSSEPYTCLFLKNFHWFLDKRNRDFEVVTQFLSDTSSLVRSKEGRKAVVVLSPFAMGESIPTEIASDFVSVGFPLPGENEIGELVDDMASGLHSRNKDFEIPDPDLRSQIIRSGKGMTLQAVEDALALSIVRTGKLDPVVLNRMMASGLEEAAGLKYIEPTVTSDQVIGYNNLKKFSLDMVKSPLSLGILLIGPPGCGKTLFMNWLGSESGLPVFELEIGAIFHKHVGESERRMLHVIEVLKAIGECIVLCDEFEKGIAGVSGSGESDSGVTIKTIAPWLKFMSSDRKGVRIYGTCNDIRKIPGEYLRAERWDCSPFYIGLPIYDAQRNIVKYYKKFYEELFLNDYDRKIKIEGNLTRKDMEGWSGAEIKSTVRRSAIRGTKLQDEKDFTIPISKTMKESITFLERWSMEEGRALPAEKTQFRFVDGAEQRRSIDI